MGKTESMQACETEGSPNNPRAEKKRARDAILEASETVFGEAGIKGATTREIARVAGVNETTLFRNFASKDVLLKAVIEKNLTEAHTLIYSAEWTYDLRADLIQYAELYTNFVKRHAPILRVVIGEMPRLPDEARQLLHPSNLPMTCKLLEYLDGAKQRGQIRTDIDSLQMAHLFLSVLLMSVLKMSMVDVPCAHEHIINTVVEMVLNGIFPGNETGCSANQKD